MIQYVRLALATVMMCAAAAWGQSSTRAPHIGYVYPAGGRQGAVIQVKVGGQFLAGVNSVYVSGEGVRATVVQYVRPLNNQQLKELGRRLKALRDARLAELPGKGRDLLLSGQEFGRKGGGKLDAKPEGKPEATSPEMVELPDHPLLHSLDTMSLPELQQVAIEFFNKKRQPNMQLADAAFIEVTIEPGAAPGDRELRLGTPAGLTNPMCFQVGTLPEVDEQEPNDPNTVPALLPSSPSLELPVVLNGQVKAGDIDRFWFQARKGQQLVIQTQARHLVPYLADAVPGWFQATLALYNAWGDEVAYDDDYRFDPDPVLFYKVPEDGEFNLEIRDALYRGREDFVYRIVVAEQPFITRAFPLGGQEGVETVASVGGWNLAKTRLPLDTNAGGGAVRQTALRQDQQLSNPVWYAVDNLPENAETEPNDTSEKAQRVSLPRIFNGRIAQPGDVDIFRIEGHSGEEVVAEVTARRLQSPLDSLLRLSDADGRVLEWNDDQKEPNTGLLTQQADSYLRVRLPKDGPYYVQVRDAQQHGGEAYAYRLRIGPPQPDYTLYATPSGLNVPAGRAVALQVHVLRRDGFDGPIELALKNAPAGFALNGGRIPAGRESMRMTLTAPRDPLEVPTVLHLEGRAEVGGQTIARPVVPAEDMMQAFLYRHLVPVQEFLVASTGPKRRAPIVELASEVPVRIPVGGTAQVRVKAPTGSALQNVRLELNDPPKGVTLQDLAQTPDGLSFVLKAEDGAVQPGFTDNLIVEASMEPAGGGQDGPAPKQKRRISLGVLPAIPMEIVPK